MFGSLFSWSGLIISVIVVLAIVAVSFFVVRETVRFVQRRRRARSHGRALGEASG